MGTTMREAVLFAPSVPLSVRTARAHDMKCTRRLTANMVMEQTSRWQKTVAAPANENLDDMHDRLGLDKLWEEGHGRMDDGLLETNSDDIAVVGDANLKTYMPWDTTTGAAGISLLGRRLAYSRKRQSVLEKSYEECRRITAIFSKTFYMGTQLLSEEKRKAVWAVYTWCRRTDDLVDGPRAIQTSEELSSILQDWELRLEEIFQGKGRDAIDLAMSDTVATYRDLDIGPFRDMVKGMVMDIEQNRFKTWDDLYLYCYRVAGTVGLMTLPIMGTALEGREGVKGATKAAVSLGIALQLTNILRDVGEDRLRGRIYLPLEDLKRFNYSEEDLFNCVLDKRYKNLMKFEIARARRYFRAAQKGVNLLSEDSQLPVQASLDMYSQILDELEANGYDNFNRRAYVSKSKKMATLPLSYLRTRKSDAWKPFLTAAEYMSGRKGFS